MNLNENSKELLIPDGAPWTGVSGIGDRGSYGDHPGIGAPTGHPNYNARFRKCFVS